MASKWPLGLQGSGPGLVCSLMSSCPLFHKTHLYWGPSLCSESLLSRQGLCFRFMSPQMQSLVRALEQQVLTRWTNVNM